MRPTVWPLPQIAPDRRVLGIIRPTAEIVGNVTRTGRVGVLATLGTIQSCSYTLEIKKLYPQIQVFGEACPMWVPLVENREYDTPGADYFIKKYIDELMAQDAHIDTVILACTHYPLLLHQIRRYLPEGVEPLVQGDIVAESLKDYLRRHPEMEQRCQRGGECTFYTTESPEKFSTVNLNLILVIYLPSFSRHTVESPSPSKAMSLSFAPSLRR